MFLAGDFKTAVQVVLAERARASGAPAASLQDADWVALCREEPAVADLFLLAVSPEYAEARWRLPTREPGTSSSRPEVP